MAGTREDAIIGCLLGTAVGDSVGLSCEGMSKRRQRQVYPEINGHHFVFRKGMISDDTEHACMVAQALIVSGGDVETFAKSLAWRFRFWLLGLPAGIGFATLRAVLKLWLGFPSHRSGVLSAGNGPAMRSAILEVCYGHDTKQLRELVRVSTRMTHTDPKAEFGALAVALAAFMAGRGSEKEVAPNEYYHTVQRVLGTDENDFLHIIQRTVTSVEARQSTESFAGKLGLSEGISGYVYHTVPVVLHAWLRHQGDYRSAIIDIVRCGGDTDTTAAIVGGIIGARVGTSGIPQEWIGGLWEWPRSVRWMEQVGKRLAEVCSQGTRGGAVPVPVYGLLARNFVFMLVVLFHGFRRLLPPY